MSSFDWQSVVDIVVKEFPTYIPVPSRDVEDYRILNFMRLAGEIKASGNPRFYYYGHKGDISFAGASSKPKPNAKPEVTSKKLWACNERAFDYGGTSKEVTFSLGTISEHKVSYGDLENWLWELTNLKDDVKKLAHEGNLFIIHTVLMAEMFVIKKGNEEDKAEYVHRPKEFGGFPIGFKVGKSLFRNVGSQYESIFRLQLEELRYFSVPYKVWWAKLKALKSAK